MSPRQEPGTETVGRQRMSDLMDGWSDRTQVEQVVGEWQSDPVARMAWHDYHLIGDVLRSEELAAPGTTDAAFVRTLRERLADEPVPLASKAPPLRAGRVGWSAVAAVAGVAAVGAVAILLRADPAASGRPVGVELAAASAPEQVTLSGKLIRDAELDRYLAAHRRAGGTAVMAVPGAVVRSVDTIAIDAK